MPVTGRRRLIRPFGNSNWTSKIPSVIFPSFLDNTIPISGSTGNALDSFLKYVENQRLPRGIKGSRSLKDIAIEVLLQRLSELDHLGDIPKHLVKCLWDELAKRCMISFHSWKILTAALHGEPDMTLGMLHYRESINSPSLPLQLYMAPLISKTYDFIASLSINVIYPASELVQLARISNLGILEIINPSRRANPDLADTISSGVGDMLLRAWSRAADENGAFSVLRILRLWNYEELTSKSLQYLQYFPSLALFDVRGCSITDDDNLVQKAEKLGWETVSRTNILDVFDEKCLEKSKKSRNSGLGLHPMEKRVTRQLWDGSRIHKVKRSVIQSLFTQSGGNSCHRFSNTMIIPLSTASRRWPDFVKEAAKGDEQWVSLSWELFCKSRNIETWEFSNAACWARIGEIIEDQDLVRAGVNNIEDQTFVGPHLVSPVRVAHIRVGIPDESGEFWGTTSTKLVAKSLDEQTTSKGCVAIIRTGQDSWTIPLSKTKSDFQPNGTGDGKRKAFRLSRVRLLKKKRLDDVLNGFMATHK